MNIADAGKEIKKELSGDEKVLESVFKLETLYKKYKFIIWAIVVVVILSFIGKVVMQTMHESKLAEANDAFLILQQKPDDTKALTILEKNNPELFELFSYSQASKEQDISALQVLAESKNSVISDASRYAQSILDNKPIDSKLYKEMVLFQQAYLAIKTGDTKLANSKLSLIDERSPLFTLATLLKHSTLKAK